MKKNFVIIGGGYGGITIAKQLLAGHIPKNRQIILVDQMPFQALKTEYYSLAAGTISDLELRIPFPTHEQLIHKYGEVVSVDLQKKKIFFRYDCEPLHYDQLVIGLGCTDQFYNIPGAEKYSCSIQSLSKTRDTYLRLSETKPYGTVHVIGGGLSGVEIAAELRESRPDLNICLLDRGKRVLSSFPEKLSNYVLAWFKQHEVNIRSSVCVSRIEHGIIHNQKETMMTNHIVWTAGIQPVKVVQDLFVDKDAYGRVLLNEHYQIPKYKEVYVVGDCASLPFAPSGQAAEIQGEQIARIQQALWKGKKRKPQALHLRGTLGSLGKKAGFGLMGQTSIIGRVPRILKSGVLWKSKWSFRG